MRLQCSIGDRTENLIQRRAEEMAFSALRVLIVEDQPSMRRILRHMLEDWGCIVEDAEHGKDGVEKYLQFRPELVLMDLLMPIMNGFDASQRIMELDPNACILLMNGLSDSTLARKALEQRLAIAVIAKPFEIQELRKSIQEAVTEQKPQSVNLARCKLSFVLFALSGSIEHKVELSEEALRGLKECLTELSEDLLRMSQL